MRCASVVICTHNRAYLLEGCIRAVGSQRAAADELEILVVDNGSTDETAVVVERLARTLPGIRYVFEPRLGLSTARNRAVAEARHDLLCFLDDDARPESGWLAHLVRGFDGRPDVGAIAGRARLVYERLPPWWLTQRIAETYSEFDLGDEPVELDLDRTPYGVNMAIRREVLVELDGFDTDLGRTKRQLLSNEEEEFFGRLLGSGRRLRYEPRAAVLHLVPPERLRLGWVLRRSYAQGRSDVRLDWIRDPVPQPRVHAGMARQAMGNFGRVLSGPDRKAALVDNVLDVVQGAGAFRERSSRFGRTE